MLSITKPVFCPVCILRPRLRPQVSIYKLDQTKKNSIFVLQTTKMLAQDLSKYIISLSDMKGDLITNKKLQKLLYYVEAWNLVYRSQLVDEDFEAWVHGPVVPYVYGNFKQFVYSPIKLDYQGLSSTKFNAKISEEFGIKDDLKDLIDEILYKYGNLTSFQLEMLSHSEKPWLDARHGLSPTEASSNKIDKDIMKAYYSSLITSNGKE